MIAIFDEDGGGNVDFQEFVSGLSAFSSKGNKEQKLRFAFKVYDIDRDGYISNGELFIVLKMMVGSNLKDQQLQQIVDKTIMEADLDKDGKISFEEFSKMVENTDVSMSMTLGECFRCWPCMMEERWLTARDGQTNSRRRDTRRYNKRTDGDDDLKLQLTLASTHLPGLVFSGVTWASRVPDCDWEAWRLNIIRALVDDELPGCSEIRVGGLVGVAQMRPRCLSSAHSILPAFPALPITRHEQTARTVPSHTPYSVSCGLNSNGGRQLPRGRRGQHLVVHLGLTKFTCRRSTASKAGSRSKIPSPSLGRGLELPPIVQDNIVNLWLSLASSQLTTCCLPLKLRDPGLVTPHTSTIIDDPLFQAALAGPSLPPPTRPAANWSSPAISLLRDVGHVSSCSCAI